MDSPSLAAWVAAIAALLSVALCAVATFSRSNDKRMEAALDRFQIMLLDRIEKSYPRSETLNARLSAIEQLAQRQSRLIEMLCARAGLGMAAVSVLEGADKQ